MALLPSEVQVGDETGHEHQVGAGPTQWLIRDAEIACPGVPNLTDHITQG